MVIPTKSSWSSFWRYNWIPRSSCSKISDAHCRLILPFLTQINQVLSLIQSSDIKFYALSNEHMQRPRKRIKTKFTLLGIRHFMMTVIYTTVIGFYTVILLPWPKCTWCKLRIWDWICKSQENTRGTCKSQENSGGYLRSGEDLKKLENLSSRRKVHMYEHIYNKNENCHNLANILQIWMIPHIHTLFEFISIPYENQHQTLYIKKIDRGQIRLREYSITLPQPYPMSQNQ